MTVAQDYLGRGDAPLSDAGWKLLDGTMAGAAKGVLAGRRILGIEGPYGLGLKAVPTVDARLKGGLVASPFVPVYLIHICFTLGKRDLAAYERDGLVFDTGCVAAAAIDCARQEDTLVFRGARGAAGLLTAEGTNSLKISSWEEVGTAADDLIQAVTRLDGTGFPGPYTLALSPPLYNLLLRRYPQGEGTELDHLRTIVTDGIHKAPVLESGGVLLASGTQYASIVLGQDMTVGFIGPADENLQFSVSESLALRIRVPGAVCVLKE